MFSDVKAEAAQSVNANNFSFNFDELAIEPILNGLKNEIVDRQQEYCELLEGRATRWCA